MWITGFIVAILVCITSSLPASANLVETNLHDSVHGRLLKAVHSKLHLMNKFHKSYKFTDDTPAKLIRQDRLPAITSKPNNLINLQTIFNLIGNGLQVLSIAWSGPCLVWSFMRLAGGVHDGTKRVMISFLGVVGGLSAPTVVGWLAGACRLAGLFG